MDTGLAGWSTHHAEEAAVRENLSGADRKAGEQPQHEQPSEFSMKKGEIRQLGDRCEGC